MSSIIFLILILLLRLSNADQKWEKVKSATPLDSQEQEAINLLRRILPNHHHLFDISVKGSRFSPHNRDQVTLMTRNIISNEVHIFNNTNNLRILKVTANTGVAAVWGINHYLKYYCNSHISWDTRRIGK